ncbi:hypothetical protein [Streptomyces sp. PTY087I2]|uniref:hypothetical protein n=1 Tax=Streptomyces sp. PTY087I2 TaxID=1819298 RepID=UPI00082757BF|nr:hypothetical protein [Streptomyces sp. PTY087I2]OCC09735.1 hypothetical protein A3Q37_04322 [Streptomyces sp. PTY087I2]
MNSVDRAIALIPSTTRPPLLVGHVLDFPAGSFTLDEVRARVAERAARLETLRIAAVRGGRSWVLTGPPEVGLHVREMRVDGRLGEELGERTDAVLRSPLPGGAAPGRAAPGDPLSRDPAPGWDLHLLTCPAEGVQRVCFRIDHALADGIGTAHLAAALLADGPVRGPHAYRPVPRGRTSSAWLRNLPLRRLPPEETVPQGFGAAPDGLETLAYADVPDSSLRTPASRRGVSVNDVFLTAVTGALTAWQRQHGDGVRDLAVMMPMSVREKGAELAPGNASVSVVVRLPCTLATPDDQLCSLIGQSTLHKESGMRDSGWRALLKAPPGLLLRSVLRPELRLATSHININDAYSVLGAPLVAASVLALNGPGLLGYFSLTRTTETARIALLHDRAHPEAAELPGACVRAVEELAELTEGP